MPSTITPQRLEAEFAADADVRRSLAENGDVPSNVRPVDAFFYGSADATDRLEKQVVSLGWRVVSRSSEDDGTQSLHLQRDQTTDADAIKKMTEACLSIEAEYGVEYDGWGTVATDQ